MSHGHGKSLEVWKRGEVVADPGCTIRGWGALGRVTRVWNQLMTHPGRNVGKSDELKLEQDLIAAQVRERHAEELGVWGPRRWLAERRVRKEIDQEISRAEALASRGSSHKKRLF